MLTCAWGESYGGHYGPVFADYIEAQNAKGTGTANISLETLTIVNGWMNPVIQVWCLDPSRELMLALTNDNPVPRLLQLYGICPFLSGVPCCQVLR